MTDPSPPDRPSLTERDHALAVLLGLWMIAGLFLDGWAHDNNKPETFFTPWHGILYSGFGAATVAALAVARRGRVPGRPWRATLPVGHGLTLAALGVFFLGAGGDLVWHELLGIEVGVEALISPTHLLLLGSGVVALSAPLRAAWARPGEVEPSLRRMLPTILVVALLAALIGFFLLYLSPFTNDAAGARFERPPGAAHDHPSRDARELGQLLGIASILMTSVLMAAPVHLILRRWRPPGHTFAILFGVVIGLLVALDEFAMVQMIPAAVLAGEVVDRSRRRAPGWLAAAVGVAALWTSYFALYKLGEGAVAWSAELWAGTVVLGGALAAIVGLPVSLAVPDPDAHVTSTVATIRSRR